MKLIFEKFNNTHREEVIRIFNYYIQETTSAYRETTVDPDYTGKGVGSAILKKLEEEATKRGIKKLIADISSENTKSIEFHRKHGFSESGRLQDIGKKFGRYFSIVFMVKDLSI